MRSIFILMLSLVLPAVAGNFNVVNLSGKGDLTIEISCDNRTQAITLASGHDSGTFTLPEQEAQFRIKDHKTDTCSVKAGRVGRILLIYGKGDDLRWHTITSKAARNQTSLRLINLTNEEVGLKIKNQSISLAAGKDQDAGVFDSLRMDVTLGDQKKQTIKVEEPTAFVGVVYPTTEGPRLQLVADR
ncbi:MAG: hypothetical protein RLZZ553_922 [Verrucomicrobiota bacterium]